MFFRHLIIGICFPLLCIALSDSFKEMEVENNRERWNTAIICFKNTPDNEAYVWLKKIFTCPEGKGYCLPDESKVLSDRFQLFIKETNKFYAFSYGRNPEEQGEAEKAYKSRWESVYPLYKEETWPFGRGNGGEEKLQNVKIEPAGGLNYLVIIDFAPSFRTVNSVRLIEKNDEFLIDYIQTEYINFQVKEGNNRNLEFTKAWTWKFKDESIAEGEIGHQGKITVYYNPKTKNWLMNRDTYGFLGEMFVWVIARPDETYLYSTSSAHFNEENSIEVKAVNWGTTNTLPSYLNKTGELKKFDAPASPSGFLTGEKYVFSGESMAESNVLYINQIKEMNFAPLFKLGSNFSGEPRLPYSFPEYLPSDFVVLKEETVFVGNQGKAYVKLESVKDTLIQVEIP